jgi:Ca-activated chloride channel family protein
MRSGILEALAPLRYGAQRQVVLVTDGLIGFESEIVGEILDRLPEGSRVHTVGVGSGVNRSLTRSAARAGRGEEVIIGIDEDAERAARRLVARTDAPLVVDLELSGDALLDSAPAKLPDLFAGAPALLSLHLRAEGGQLAVRGRTERGVWEHRLQVSPAAEATGDAAIAALYARERVDDLETLRAAHGDPAIDNEIERLGLAFSIATRLTSWVAIDEEASVDPREPTRRVRMPHELPYGMSAEGVGLRPAMAPTGVMRSLAFAAPAAPMPAAPMAPQRRRVFGGLTRSRPAAPGAAGGTGGAPPPAGGPPRMGAAPPPPPTGAPPQPHETTQTGVLRTTRILKGVILLHTDEQIVVEFTLDERDLDWSTPSFAELHLEQSVVSAPVDATRSTRSGTVAAGSTLRITLQHAGARPNAVMLELPGTTLLIGL